MFFPKPDDLKGSFTMKYRSRLIKARVIMLTKPNRPPVTPYKSHPLNQDLTLIEEHFIPRKKKAI
jgi:hypothetical protein